MEYTNAKTNDLFILLDRAYKIADDLRAMNLKNHAELSAGSVVKIFDDRMISNEQRIEEAEEYINIFSNLRDILGNMQKQIANTQNKYNPL